MTSPEPSLDFKALFEALPGAYLVLDRDYRILAASDTYLDSLGGTARERLIGRDLFSIQAKDASASAKTAFADLRASFDRVMAGGAAETLPHQRYEVRRTGGGLRQGYLSVVNTALKDTAGVIRWLIHRVHDVTESQVALLKRDQAEEARRTMESQHALALVASGLGAWDYDRTRSELVWDARGRELLGIAADGPMTFAVFIELIHPDDREEVRRRVDEILRPDGPQELTITYRVVGEAGISAWLEARGRAFFVNDECVRVSGVVADVTERQRYESHLRLLINELNHRVKNTLAVVQSIAMQTLQSDLPTAEARSRFVDRLMALAAAHDILTRENWEGAELADIVARALAPHDAAGPDRISTEGPAVRVSPRVALSLAMALHELATNAVKYGALSTPTGCVDVGWTLCGAPGHPDLRLVWSERGGPPVSTPTRKGFGLRLLERVLAQDISGKVEVEFAPSGLTATVLAPASAWRPQSGDENDGDGV